MLGKRPFPWPQKLPELTHHKEPEKRILLINWSEKNGFSASIHASDQCMNIRLDTLLKAGIGMASLLRKRHRQGSLRIQLHDEDPLIPCIRLDASSNDFKDSNRPLIPDPYCLMTKGYWKLREQMQKAKLPPWHERLPLAFWRGSTTGTKNIDVESLALNRRYQLARLSHSWPHHLDAGINRVVQCNNADAQRQVEEHLYQLKLLRPTTSPWHAALHAWQIDIDGNVNSWGLLWKLLSGSCILRVESSRRQWYHQRIQPWVHLVPIREDLSDLGEQLDWCRCHPRECSEIAAAGQTLAEQVVNEIDDDLMNAGVRYAQAWM